MNGQSEGCVGEAVAICRAVFAPRASLGLTVSLTEPAQWLVQGKQGTEVSEQGERQEWYKWVKE